LALAASVTSKLLLRPGVTNSFTRHPAVTAASILTVQIESKGRAVLGIGRGDSALAHLGLAPMPVPLFRKYVERVQGYLRGEELIDTFTIAGSAEHCVERLLALRALGITKFHLLTADWRNCEPALQEHARKSLAQELLPGDRTGCARYDARA
jgi:alkanesulfonate monooxygenase SsuD/methylene tetrahydromethanopterin reductase-like flavin-dependent oxidoreductase (luciferase family)